jgi:competence protein ComEC
MSSFFAYTNLFKPTSISAEIKVKLVEETTYGERLTVSYHFRNYYIYAYQKGFSTGDRIIVEGMIKPFMESSVLGGFNLKSYLLSKNIHGTIEIEKLEFVSNRFSIWTLREKLIQHTNTLTSKTHLNAYLFGEKQFEDEQKDLYQSLGISFLFSVSGLHLYAFVELLKKTMYHLDFESKDQKVAVTISYVIFLYLQAFSMSTVRLFLSFLLYEMTHKLKIQLNRVERTYIVFMIMLFVNIGYIYHIGFLMSFLILMSLALLEDRYMHKTNYFKALDIAFIVYLTMLPFYPRVTPLLVLIMPIFVFLLSKPLFFLSIITLIIPIADPMTYRIYSIFDQIFGAIEKFNVIFYLPSLPKAMMVLYYVLLIYFFCANTLKSKLKRLILLIGVFVLTLYSNIHFHDLKVIMLDVGQGDSIIIQSPNCVVVIDSYKNVSNYLRYQGIHKIDYLVLTHHHLDHTKEASDLLIDFNVETLVLNPYDAYDVTFIKTSKLKSGDYFQCSHYRFNILGPIQQYENTNNNSLVIQVRFSHKTFLFTGDIEYHAEMDLVKKYGDTLKSDVLKIAHHGSSTSTHASFFKHVMPKVVLISVGNNNRHRFPHQSVINFLMTYELTIYRTDQKGSVTYKQSKKRENWTTLLP